MYREQVRVITPAREWYEAECQQCAWSGEYYETGRAPVSFDDEASASLSAEYHAKLRRHAVIIWRVVDGLPLTADKGTS